MAAKREWLRGCRARLCRPTRNNDNRHRERGFVSRAGFWKGDWFRGCVAEVACFLLDTPPGMSPEPFAARRIDGRSAPLCLAMRVEARFGAGAECAAASGAAARARVDISL